MIQVKYSSRSSLLVLLLALTVVGCGAPKSQSSLIYVPDMPPGASTNVNMPQLVSAIERRLTPPPAGSRVRVLALSNNQIEIRVQFDDPAALARVESLLDRPGVFELRILANQQDHAQVITAAKADPNDIVFAAVDSSQTTMPQTELGRWVRFIHKPNEQPFSETAIIRASGPNQQQLLVIKDDKNVDGRYLVKADIVKGQLPDDDIALGFNERGGALLKALTAANLPDQATGQRRYLGVILDGFVFCAPAIMAPIGESATLTGGFSKQEAEDLVQFLRSGALPVPIKKVSPAAPPLTSSPSTTSN